MNESLKTFVIGLPIMLAVPWFCLGLMTLFDAGQSPKGDYEMGKTFRIDFHEQRATWAAYYTSWGPGVLILLIFPEQWWITLIVGATAACYGAAIWMHRSWNEYTRRGRAVRIALYILFNWISVGFSTWIVLDRVQITFERQKKERARA